MKTWLLVMGILAAGTESMAQNVLVGNASFAGTGCQAGRSPRIYMRSGRLMTKFNFTVNDQELRKACAMSVPVSTQPGYKIVAESANFLTSTAGRITAIANTEAFFLGVDASESKSAALNVSSGTKWSGDLALGSESDCSGKAQLRVNTDLRVLSRGVVKLDTLGIKLVAVKCL